MIETVRFAIPDRRVCWRCGARAGACSHIERDDHVAEIPVFSVNREPKPLKWSDWELEQLSDLWRRGHTASEIGELLNRSRNAVTGVVVRMNLQRSKAA